MDISRDGEGTESIYKPGTILLCKRVQETIHHLALCYVSLQQFCLLPTSINPTKHCRFYYTIEPLPGNTSVSLTKTPRCAPSIPATIAAATPAGQDGCLALERVPVNQPTEMAKRFTQTVVPIDAIHPHRRTESSHSSFTHNIAYLAEAREYMVKNW